MTARPVRAMAAAVLLVVVLAVAAGSSVTGERAVAVPPGSVTVVGLGDSVMAGTHCGCAGIMASYAARERSLHPDGPPLVPVNLGEGGATTRDLLANLRREPHRAAVRRARVVVVVIGANDLLPQRGRFVGGACSRTCYEPAVRAMGRRLDVLLGALRSDRRTSAGPVLVTDYWNVFEDGAQTLSTTGGPALVAFGRAVTRVANRAICAAAAHYRDTCVDLYDSLLGPSGTPTRLLAPDGDHPDAAGVRLIATLLARATPAGTFTDSR